MELKAGDDVIVRDSINQKWKRGKYMAHHKGVPYPHYVLVDNQKHAEFFKHCQRYLEFFDAETDNDDKRYVIIELYNMRIRIESL